MERFLKKVFNALGKSGVIFTVIIQQFAVQICKVSDMQDYYFACCFVWV
jgi:hypothetical protein